MRDLNRFRGCLIGGAAGDALGYAVEFDSVEQIFRQYGPDGITGYELNCGLARISDDTQMTLFTANGLLLAAAAGSADWSKCIGLAYREWYLTQRPGENRGGANRCWLMDVPELHALRAPGNTCLSALSGEVLGSPERPVNHSKGCGGVMRAAPVGLFFDEGAPAGRVLRVGAEAAALTHGHALGWLPGAALARIVHILAHDPAATVESAARATIDALPLAFPEAAHVSELQLLLNRALELARRRADDPSYLRELGEGWVGDEALAVALYCAAKYESDFDRALIASVNHSGDSDSTGAICGNILGARLGLSGIPRKYLDKLECRDAILEIADDLHSWPERVEREPPDEAWARKYVRQSGAPGRG